MVAPPSAGVWWGYTQTFVSCHLTGSWVFASSVFIFASVCEQCLPCSSAPSCPSAQFWPARRSDPRHLQWRSNQTHLVRTSPHQAELHDLLSGVQLSSPCVCMGSILSTSFFFFLSDSSLPTDTLLSKKKYIIAVTLTKILHVLSNVHICWSYESFRLVIKIQLKINKMIGFHLISIYISEMNYFLK